jgi:hypothetical protein
MFIIPSGWEDYVGPVRKEEIQSEEDQRKFAAMDPKRFLKAFEASPVSNPYDPYSYKIDFQFFKDMKLIDKETEQRFLAKFPDLRPIPRNRVRSAGIKTKVEIEPKEFQIIILCHSSYCMAKEDIDTKRNINKCLIGPRSVLISNKSRF